jgi:hypothetical protein
MSVHKRLKKPRIVMDGWMDDLQSTHNDKETQHPQNPRLNQQLVIKIHREK